MTAIADRKLYLGPRLRVLRRELGLNQTQMAEELGVSPSYLNHLERNQRPLTAQMLLRLAHTYDIDLREFVAAANEASASGLHEIFADGLVRDLGIGRNEVIEVAENYPAVAEAVGRLYRALGDLRRMPERVEQLGAAAQLAAPLDWLRDVLEQKRNHFPEIERLAETLSARLGTGPEMLLRTLPEQLQADHGISMRVMPEAVLVGALRHYDFHRRRLMLSERLPIASRLFGMAFQLASESLKDLIATTISRTAPPDEEAARLLRVALINYAAAAILMPYPVFAAAAEESRYDMDLLMARFGASYEQVAHRLTTLDRQGERGVPFFLLKIDTAGNVAKRHAIDGAPIARFGGGCPRWRVHRAFRQPGETIVDRIETLDGARFLTFARALPRIAAREPTTIILGCEEKYARRLLYGDVLAEDAVTPIGPACQVCTRVDCRERSLPPVTRVMELQPYQRPAAPYPFRAI